MGICMFIFYLCMHISVAFGVTELHACVYCSETYRWGSLLLNQTTNSNPLLARTQACLSLQCYGIIHLGQLCSGNASAPIRHQDFTWTRLDFLPIVPLGTNFCAFWIIMQKIFSQTNSFQNVVQNVCHFVSSLNVLIIDGGWVLRTCSSIFVASFVV